MRQNWTANRVLFLFATLSFCGCLIVVSATGILAPVEGVAATPLNIISGFFNRLSIGLTNTITDLSEIQNLQERNAQLEEIIALNQIEIIQLREIASDYDRLAGLLNYTTSVENQEFVTADVIGRDQNAVIRSIIINRGSRDGIAIGMPVVTELGLVGRVIQVSADASQVQLITDENSAVSARLQTTRDEGSVIGQLSGGLRLTFVNLDSNIIEGDLVFTSGLGGNFPPDILIGQVTSVQQFEFELFQSAEVRSRIDFDTLEFVLVITSFQPVDLSVFEEPES